MVLFTKEYLPTSVLCSYSYFSDYDRPYSGSIAFQARTLMYVLKKVKIRAINLRWA